MYIVGGLMLLLSLAGLYHASKTPRTKGFAVPESAAVNGSEKVLVNAI